MAGLKGLKDSFAHFFEDPSRSTLRALLKDHAGETRFLDFKTEWPDNAGLAKQCLGLANTEGGCLVVGVEERADKSLDPVGLSAFKDKADITNGIKNFVSGPILRQIQVLDFRYEDSEYEKIRGKSFQVLIVEFDAGIIPAIAMKASNGIRKGAIYYRNEGVTEEGSYEEVQTILAKRILHNRDAPERDLKHHLQQLKVLYENVPRQVKSDLLFPGIGQIGSIMRLMARDNPAYPKEDFDSFVLRMIQKKKLLVEQEIGISVEPPSS